MRVARLHGCPQSIAAPDIAAPDIAVAPIRTSF